MRPRIRLPARLDDGSRRVLHICRRTRQNASHQKQHACTTASHGHGALVGGEGGCPPCMVPVFVYLEIFHLKYVYTEPKSQFASQFSRCLPQRTAQLFVLSSVTAYNF
eukprot:1632187-Rhodomonas_salina.1